MHKLIEYMYEPDHRLKWDKSIEKAEIIKEGNNKSFYHEYIL